MLAKIFSAFLFLTAVTANLHDSCTCHNGDSYNWRMTTNACGKYNDAGYKWGGSVYDTPSGRVSKPYFNKTVPNANDSSAPKPTQRPQLAGKEWEAACKEIAQTGFQCADGVGTCYADPDEVRGRC
ncbi:hypothetical protein NM208_g12767 [Fusarium decemcellulare]|uniref:Uncharacterized protein n=1 Tax=Fusarium decemcellulare TaxID=57161 RepID=A0ACC1RMD5_9HYPO|nr:hypothetical protein NM208_g12767 [Fusarium decemcellulare]